MARSVKHVARCARKQDSSWRLTGHAGVRARGCGCVCPGPSQGIAVAFGVHAAVFCHAVDARSVRWGTSIHDELDSEMRWRWGMYKGQGPRGSKILSHVAPA